MHTMFSNFRSRYNTLYAVFSANIKYAHRNAGRGRRNQQVLTNAIGEHGEEMLNDADKLEDLNDWIENSMHKPEFQEQLANEEHILRKKVTQKIIERKYFKKPQEINLLTWDAKAQIRFLHSEYPDEWTVDRLAESFPVSREGVIHILNSSFYVKSFGEVIKHDKRVKKNWLALKEGKKNELLNSGPVISRYEELLKNAAGNPSLPKPDMNHLLLDSGKEKRDVENMEKLLFGKRIKVQKTGVFLSIVKDYCDKKDTAVVANLQNHAKSKKQDLLEEHITENQKLIADVVGKKLPSTSTPKYSKTLTAFESQDPMFKKQLDVSADDERNTNVLLSSKQLLEANFDYNPSEKDSNEAEDIVKVHRKSRRLRLSASASKTLHSAADSLAVGMKGTKKLLNETAEKMEANSRLIHDLERPSAKQVLDKKVEDVLQQVTSDEDTQEMYIYSEESGYQYPFGQKKNLPASKIPIPPVKSNKPGVEFRKGDDIYDEDGEFLYRIP